MGKLCKIILVLITLFGCGAAPIQQAPPTVNTKFLYKQGWTPIRRRDLFDTVDPYTKIQRAEFYARYYICSELNSFMKVTDYKLPKMEKFRKDIITDPGWVIIWFFTINMDTGKVSAKPDLFFTDYSNHPILMKYNTLRILAGDMGKFDTDMCVRKTTQWAKNELIYLLEGFKGELPPYEYPKPWHEGRVNTGPLDRAVEKYMRMKRKAMITP